MAVRKPHFDYYFEYDKEGCPQIYYQPKDNPGISHRMPGMTEVNLHQDIDLARNGVARVSVTFFVDTKPKV